MQATAERTSQEWELVITDLTAKASAADSEAAELVREADSLALDAELGHDGAANRLKKIAAEISTKRQTAQTARAAITQAQRLWDEARAAENNEAERQRQAELSTLATAAIRHATT